MSASGTAFFFFFPLVLFSYGNDCDTEAAVAFCWFVDWSERFAPRQKDQQAEPDCSGSANLDLTLCGRGSLHLMSHEAGDKVHPSPLLSQPKGEGLSHHFLLHLN